MSTLYKFQSLSPVAKLVVLTALLDPIGLAGGYLLGPAAGFDPFMGAVVGVAITSSVTSLWFIAGQT
ncbi:hypothetical protein [Salinarchaeum laminariae]|uniref:hypothetical protein n=1 Tax=Salinarchaeum laminariae TaxID=869888 RepID=UPI0020BD7495|nr:hypothetical protein [Salinarchaeum laminariae]